MSGFYNPQGEIQQYEIGVTDYAAAQAASQTLPHYLNSRFPTDPTRFGGSSFQQMCASEGIFVRPNAELGISGTKMKEITDGTRSMSGEVNTRDGVPTSRILFPAVILQAVEDRLQANLSMTANAFESFIASDEAIGGERYEQPVLNFDRPSEARHKVVAQLAKPASMLTITTSQKAYTIPTYALGLEISDQALASTTIDLVALSLARQASVESNERAQGYVLALLLGDPDNADGALSAIPGTTRTSTFYDANSTVGGTFTQKSWMKYLLENGTKRTITNIVTDFDTAMRIENRTGKPTMFTDDPKSTRIDTTFSVMNPTWAKNPALFLTQDPNWPAGTLMGFDKNFAIRRVRNINADYDVVEAYVMRRSKQMRFDFGEHVNRLFPDAYGVMVM